MPRSRIPLVNVGSVFYGADHAGQAITIVWPHRRFTRYPVQLPLLYNPEDPKTNRVEPGWTRELSPGGACLELGERLQSAGILHVKLRTAHSPFETEAQVIWAGEPTSPADGIPHGVVFRQLAPEDVRTLHSQLPPVFQGTYPRVRLPVDLGVTCRPKRSRREPLQGRVGNMSRGGMLLYFGEGAAAGTEVETTIQTRTGPIRVDGRIIWADLRGSPQPIFPPPAYATAGDIAWIDLPARSTPDQPILHGVQFTSLDWPVSLRLGHFLAEQA
jgi:hypothetical protein